MNQHPASLACPPKAMHLSTPREKTGPGGAWLLLMLLAVHFGLRWYLATHGNFYLTQTDYDESVTGLMALDVLRGHWQIMFWGQPYMGTLEPVLAALVFKVMGPSTLALRLTLILVSSLGLWALYSLGRLAGGPLLGFLAGLFWALPPVFLAFDGLYATGGHLESVVGAAIFLYGACRLTFAPPKRPLPLALGLGLVAGLACWCSLLVAPLVLAVVLALLLARPRLLLGLVPWALLLGFLAGSGPFWWWNLNHDFMTFRAIEHGQGHTLAHFYGLTRDVWLPAVMGDWWDGHSVEQMLPRALRLAVGLGVYLPVLLLMLGLGLAWLYRLARGRNPLAAPQDFWAAALMAALLAHASSAYGGRGFTRYALAIFPALTMLLGWWLYLVMRRSRLLGGLLLALLLGLNLTTNVLFVRDNARLPRRPIDAAIAVLHRLGITHAYAQGRIAYPLDFQSDETLTVADHYGWRNYAYLRQVDEKPDAALITHDILGNPAPGQMKAALKLLGAAGQRVQVGDYIFWHGFQAPPPASPLPATEWKVTTSTGESGALAAVGDRDLSTAWAGPRQPGDWLTVDLGASHDLCRLFLVPQPGPTLNPGDSVSLRVETSQDGQQWQTAVEGEGLAGLVWAGGHPKLDYSTVLEINFPARPARYLRLVFPKTGPAYPSWPLAELYLCQAAAQETAPPAPALADFQQAKRLLAAWSEEPTGPHPLFPGVPPAYREGRVDWLEVIARLRRAIQQAPDWPEPQLLLQHALHLGGLQQAEVWPGWTALALREGRATALPLDPNGPSRVQGLELEGQGLLRLGRGWPRRHLKVEGHKPLVLPLEPSPERLRVECLAGTVLLKPLRDPGQMAKAYLQAGQPGQASELLAAQSRLASLDSAQALDYVQALEAQGQAGPAAADLLRAQPQLPSWLEQAAQAPLAGPWPEPWRALAGWGPWAWEHHSLELPARELKPGAGLAVGPGPSEPAQGATLRVGPGQPGSLKLWLAPYLPQGRYLVGFRLRAPGPEPPQASLGLLRHYQDRVHDQAASLAWPSPQDPATGQWQEVVLSLDNRLAPVKLEADLRYLGGGPLEVEQVWLRADPRPLWAAQQGRLARLAPAPPAQPVASPEAPAPANAPQP